MAIVLKGVSILILIAFCIMAVALSIPKVIPNALPGHIEHPEAYTIRECAQDPTNVLQVWLNASGERLNCLIRTPDGVGDWVIQFSCRRLQWIEITAYLFKQPTLGDAVEVLRAKGCERVY